MLKRQSSIQDPTNANNGTSAFQQIVGILTIRKPIPVVVWLPHFRLRFASVKRNAAQQVRILRIRVWRVAFSRICYESRSVAVKLCGFQKAR
jgi:hypothetical protein